MSMTPEDLAAIERRLNAATPGPWYCEVDGWPVRNITGGSVPWWAAGIDDSEGNPYRPYAASFATLDFTAEARTDVAVLLAEVKELRAALMPFAALYTRMCDTCCVPLGYETPAWDHYHRAWELCGKPELKDQPHVD